MNAPLRTRSHTHAHEFAHTHVSQEQLTRPFPWGRETSQRDGEGKSRVFERTSTRHRQHTIAKGRETASVCLHEAGSEGGKSARSRTCRSSSAPPRASRAASSPRASTCAREHTYAHSLTHSLTHLHTHTYTIAAHLRPRTRARARARIRMHTHTHSCARARVHTHTHTRAAYERQSKPACTITRGGQKEGGMGE